MRKRALALALACLCLAAWALEFPGAARASSPQVYFTVVNDTVLDLRGDTMPFHSGGQLYVPYSVFDPGSCGVSLGVYATYSNNIAMIYSRSHGALMFDLAGDTATSSLGESYATRAIRRNSAVYVPVSLVADCFGLSWSLLVERDFGFIVRIKSAAAQYTDREFVPAAKNTMTSRYNAYLQSVTGADPYEEPTPTPEPSPSPSPSPSAAPRPTAPPGGDVYLGFRCAAQGEARTIAAALAPYQAQAVFFFPPDALAAREDEVRALAAAGHRIGLLLDGESPQQRRDQGELGRRLLGHILRAGADVALLPAGTGPPEGWLAWTPQADGTAGERTPARQLADTVRDAVRPEGCLLLLDDGAQTAALLPQLLSRLSAEGCAFRLTLEPMLGG